MGNAVVHPAAGGARVPPPRATPAEWVWREGAAPARWPWRGRPQAAVPAHVRATSPARSRPSRRRCAPPRPPMRLQRATAWRLRPRPHHAPPVRAPVRPGWHAAAAMRAHRNRCGRSVPADAPLHGHHPARSPARRQSARKAAARPAPPGRGRVPTAARAHPGSARSHCRRPAPVSGPPPARARRVRKVRSRQRRRLRPPSRPPAMRFPPPPRDGLRPRMPPGTAPPLSPVRSTLLSWPPLSCGRQG